MIDGIRFIMARPTARYSMAATLYAVTIGTPASASSRVTVPDFASAALAMRKAASFSAGATTMRGGRVHCSLACRMGSTRWGTVGMTTSSAPMLALTLDTASENTASRRRISPILLPGSMRRTGGDARRRRASSVFGRSRSTLSVKG